MNFKVGNSFFNKIYDALSAPIITVQPNVSKVLIIGMQRVACPSPQSRGDKNIRGVDIKLLNFNNSFKIFAILIN